MRSRRDKGLGFRVWGLGFRVGGVKGSQYKLLKHMSTLVSSGRGESNRSGPMKPRPCTTVFAPPQYPTGENRSLTFREYRGHFFSWSRVLVCFSLRPPY